MLIEVLSTSASAPGLPPSPGGASMAPGNGGQRWGRGEAKPRDPDKVGDKSPCRRSIPQWTPCAEVRGWGRRWRREGGGDTSRPVLSGVHPDSEYPHSSVDDPRIRCAGVRVVRSPFGADEEGIPPKMRQAVGWGGNRLREEVG
jgi:hypothetical protein